MRRNINLKSFKRPKTLSNGVETWLLPFKRQNYRIIFQEQLFEYLNCNPGQTIIRIDKNGFGNSLKKYKTLIKIYKRSWPKYQRCAQVPLKKNLFISQVNEIKTKQSLEIAQKTFYLVKFCLEINCAWQVICYLIFKVQKYHQLYELDQKYAKQNWELKDFNW